jgi:hypothetical protein
MGINEKSRDPHQPSRLTCELAHGRACTITIWISRLARRNYGARPARSTVKLGENVVRHEPVPQLPCYGHGICALGIR